MRRLFFILILVLFITPSAFAAWTVDATVEFDVKGKTLIKLTLTSDASSTSFSLFDTTLNTALSSRVKASLNGKYLYRVSTDPDGSSPPAAAYDLTITDYLGDILSLTSRSVSATEPEPGSSTTSSKYLSIYNETLTIASGTLGNGNIIVLYLEFV